MNIGKKIALERYNESKRQLSARDAQERNRAALTEAALKAENRAARIVTEAQNKKVRYSKWVNEVKEALISESIKYIFDQCFNRVYLSEDLKYNNIKENMIKTFIKTEGANNLLNRMKYGSEFLAEFAVLIEKAHKDICKSVDCKDDEYVIDTETRDSFFNNVTNISVDKITSKICDRVGDAVEDFVIQNAKKRSEIKDVLQKAQDKISGSAAQQESANIVTTRKIRSIQNRPTNLFGAMVMEVAKATVKLPEENRKQFVKEDGNIDIDSVVEATKVMYTFLETVNTLKLADFNEKVVADVVANINK